MDGSNTQGGNPADNTQGQATPVNAGEQLAQAAESQVAEPQVAQQQSGQQQPEQPPAPPPPAEGAPLPDGALMGGPLNGGPTGPAVPGQGNGGPLFGGNSSPFGAPSPFGGGNAMGGGDPLQAVLNTSPSSVTSTMNSAGTLPTGGGPGSSSGPSANSTPGGSFNPGGGLGGVPGGGLGNPGGPGIPGGLGGGLGGNPGGLGMPGGLGGPNGGPLAGPGGFSPPPADNRGPGTPNTDTNTNTNEPATPPPDTRPTLSITGSQASEADGVLTVTVTLSSALGANSSFTWTVQPGSGQLADITTAPGMVTIPAGQSSVTFTIDIADDGADELAETLVVQLTGASPNVKPPDGIQTVITITDDDAPEGASDTATLAAGTDQVVIDVLPNDSESTVAVHGVTQPTKGTVTLNPDGTVTFERGEDFDYLGAGESAQVTFTYQARDAEGQVDASPATVTVTVWGTNDAPVLNQGVADQSTAEDAAFSFQVPGDAFADTDQNDSLTYTATLANGSPLPDWLTFNAASRTFSGTPANAQVGSLQVRVTATDSADISVADTFTLTVTNTNDAPTAGTVSGQSATEDAAFTFQVPGATFADVDAGDSLTYTATLANGSPLPGWLAFDGVTRTFTGTPANGDVGTLQVKVTATDAASTSASATFALAIANTNDAPTSPGLALNVAQQDTATGTLTYGDVDLDDTASFEQVSAPTRGTVTIGADGQVSYTANAATRSLGAGESATDTVTYKVTDNHGASTTATLTVTIEGANDAVVIAGGAQAVYNAATDTPAIIAGGIVLSDPDTTTVIQSATVTVTGAGSNAVLAVTGLPDGMTASQSGNVLTLTGNGTLAQYQAALRAVTFTDPDLSPGDAAGTVTIQVNDGTSSNAFTRTLDITDNTPPELTGGGAVAHTEGASASALFPALTVTDAEGGSLTQAVVSIVAGLSAGDTLALAGSHPGVTATYASGTLTLDYTGTAADWEALLTDVVYSTASDAPATGERVIQLSVKDGTHFSQAITSTVTVSPVNDAPNAPATGSATAAEDAVFSFTVPAFTDPDGETPAYTATLANGDELPTWLSFNPVTRVLSGSPANQDVGSLSVKVTATDAAGLSASDTFTLTVTNTNDAPTVTAAIASQSATEDSAFIYVVPAGLFADVDAGDTLTWTATKADGSLLPDWLVFDGATRTFTGTPANGDVGTLQVKVIGADAAATSASTSFTLNIGNINDAPTVANAIADQSTAEDAPFTFQVPANAFADLDAGDTLTYTATLDGGADLPTWLSFNATTRTFSGTPANQHVGGLAVKVTATDSTGISVSDSFTLTVTNTPDTPVAGVDVADQSALTGRAFSLIVPAGAFTDVDAGEVFTWSASNMPDWLSFDAATRTFSGTPDGSDLGEATVTVMVTDRDGLTSSQSFTLTVQDKPALSVTDVTVGEAAGTATITITSSTAFTEAVSADWSLGGTATAGIDYTGVTSGTVTIPAGQTSVTIQVALTNDLLDETDEQITVQLANPSANAQIGDGSATVTITDNDPTPTLSVSTANVDEAAGTITYTVTLSAASGRAVTVDYATSSSDATAGTDYTSGTGTLSFAPGETTKTVTVAIANDTIDEADEAVTLGLTNPSNATIASATANAAITDNDPVPTLSVGDLTVGEDGTATLTVSLSAASGRSVTVDWATQAGTAGASDFTAGGGTLTFAPGETTKTVTVTLANDPLDEADEALTVTLTNASNATIADGSATVTVTDNDPLPIISIGDVTIAEGGGTAAFEISLSAASGRDISVSWGTLAGTAQANSDFQHAGGTVTIPAGQSSVTVQVPIVDNAQYEAGESFTIQLSNPDYATLGVSLGTATITDNDPMPTVSVTGPNTIGESVGFAAFTFTLNQAAGTPVSLTYETVAGSAVDGSDFTAASATLTFQPGETQKTVQVPILNDTDLEPAEAFTVQISGTTGLNVGTASATATIAASDQPGPTVSVTGANGSETTGLVTFTVTLSAPPSGTVTVDYATAADGALAGSDYVHTMGTLSFDADHLSRTVTVQLLNDTDAEYSESFGLQLSNAQGATIARDEDIAIITDTDDPAAASEGSASVVGTNSADTLTGSGGHDVLIGRDGADSLIGGGSDDLLWGGAGNDFLYGGAGEGAVVYDRSDLGYTDTVQVLESDGETSVFIDLAAFNIDNNNDGYTDIAALTDLVSTEVGQSDVVAMLLPNGGGGIQSYATASAALNALANANMTGDHAADDEFFLLWQRGDGANAATVLSHVSHYGTRAVSDIAVFSNLLLDIVADSDVLDVTTVLDEATSGSDVLTGTMVADVIDGQGGADIIHGWMGNDSLTGGTGNDTFVYFGADSGNGTDVITDFCGDNAGVDAIGIDDFHVDRGTVGVGDILKVTTGGGTVNIAAHDVVLFNPGSSFATGAAALSALGTVTGGSEFFLLWSRAGDSNTVFSHVKNGVINDLAVLNDIPISIADQHFTNDQFVTAATLWGNDDTTKNRGGASEELHGGSGADTIYGNAGRDALFGNGSADEIHGGTEADWIRGGTGADTLRGDAGADSFVYHRGDLSGGPDIIEDFQITEAWHPTNNFNFTQNRTADFFDLTDFGIDNGIKAKTDITALSGSGTVSGTDILIRTGSQYSSAGLALSGVTAGADNGQFFMAWENLSGNATLSLVQMSATGIASTTDMAVMENVSVDDFAAATGRSNFMVNDAEALFINHYGIENNAAPLAWASDGETAGYNVTIGYTFDVTNATNGTYGYGYGATVVAFSEAQQTNIRMALQMIEDVAGIKFVEKGSYASADMALFMNDQSIHGPSQDGTWWSPNYTNEQVTHVLNSDPVINVYSQGTNEVVMNSQKYATDSFAAGSASHMIMLHEIEHLLGMDHPGEYHDNDGNQTQIEDSAFLSPDKDTVNNSVMTYSGIDGNWGTSSAWTPMLLDIAALQHLYGTNTTTRTGDTVYGVGSNAGNTFTIDGIDGRAFAIWDAGGTDTLSAAGLSTASVLDLREGGLSSIGSDGTTAMQKNVAIAYGAEIENAIGGTGNDTLIGNDLANTLTGALGNDILTGGAGADIFRYTAATHGGDVITDFQSGYDAIQVVGSAFGNLGNGGLTSANFRSGAGALAQDADDYFVYDTSSNKLYYDQDGSAAGGRVELADLGDSGAVTLTHDDIDVVAA